MYWSQDIIFLFYSEMVWMWLCVYGVWLDTGHCVSPLARDCGDWVSSIVRSHGGWRSDALPAASRTSGRRIAFISLYIDTVMNAKFGKGAYTLSPLSNWDVCSQNPYRSLMCDLCHVFIVVSMSKLRNPTGEGGRHGTVTTLLGITHSSQRRDNRFTKLPLEHKILDKP